MILAVFFCKGGLQWLYNLGCKQCMMNITSIYKKDNAGMKTQKLWIDFAKQVRSDGPSKKIFQRRFVVIVYPMQARRVCTLGNCRCRKCSDIHTGCPKWDQMRSKYSFLYSSHPQACSCCRVGPINIPRCPHNSDEGLGNCDW